MLDINNIEDGDLLGTISLGPDGSLIASPGLAEEIAESWRAHGFGDPTIYNEILPGWSNGYVEIVPGMPDPEPPVSLVDGDLGASGQTNVDSLQRTGGAPDLAKVNEGAVGKYKARNLIKWFNEGGGGQIAWGTPGDFAECSRLAIEHGHMTPEQAHGFCNLRHRDATGAAPGHAAGEAHKADTPAPGTPDAEKLPHDDPGVQYRPAPGATEQCQTCAMYSAGVCSIVQQPIYPDGVCDRHKPIPVLAKADGAVPVTNPHDGPDYDPEALGIQGPTRLQMVDPQVPNVDRQHYQRDLNLDRVSMYEQAPKKDLENRVGLLARRPDGSLWTIDGQHHTLAAIGRGVGKLPYRVFDSTGPEQEAGIFQAWNKRERRS